MKNRMVCECYDITVEVIEKALREGATGFDDLVQSMKLGVLCSACVGDAKRVVAQLQEEIAQESK